MLGRTKHKNKSKDNTLQKAVNREEISAIDRYTTAQFVKMTGKMAWMTVRSFWRRHRIVSRLIAIFLVLIILFSLFYSLYESKREVMTYEIDDLNHLIGEPIDIYTSKLVYAPDKQNFLYNEDYIPGEEVAGDTYMPKITATLGGSEDEYTVTVNDPESKVSVSLKPKFRLSEPKQSDNRVVYPIKGKDAVNIYTVKGTGIKEDIVLRTKPAKDKLDFKYELTLSDGLEARLESDGSIGIYGVESTLLGDVATGSESDAELLKKARDNGDKTNFLFGIPAPVVLEGKAKKSTATASFSLENNVVTITTVGLSEANYPLTIDPTVYVESARKLMRGNNETNIDFDVDNELIQKSQTTGARINAWEDNLDMSEGIWDSSTAAAGGYVYRSGGRTGMSKPQVVSEQTTVEATADTSFQMNMPAVRPAGDLYIAIMCHDDATDTITEPAGWTEYADVGEFSAYWKIGTDQGGGNEAASYTWTVSSAEAKGGSIIRITGFNASDPISGTPGTGSNGSDSVPVFPATTPDNSATLVIRAAGADNDNPGTGTGWVPSGHTKIASGESGGGAGNRCGFVAASLDTSPASGVSTGTAALIGGAINDSWGAASIAINPSGTPLMPVVQGFQASQQATNSNNFTMNMPATRPAGDLYIAIMCHDGTGFTVNPPDASWNEYADLGEHAAYWKIGENKGGGNEQASYTWTKTGGTGEMWGGVVMRITGFDSSNPVNTSTTGSSGSNSTPQFPSITPSNSNTLIIRSVGADNDVPSATAWVPSNHTKIASGESGGGANNRCGYVSASMDNSPAGGNSTGSTTLGDASISDTWGASSIAINAAPAAGAESVRSTLDWAEFNSSTLEIESPNPGEGVCSGWCNDPTYNLPAGRRGHSMIAYNGYLYVMGGIDSTGARVSSVFIAKLGANGEPQLWHPTNSNPASWEYWYIDSGLSGGTAKSYFSAVAYNNRLYVIGGQTNASPGGITTVQEADFLPNGILGTWTTSGMQALPSGAGTHMQTAQIYNDTIYNIGGFEGASTSSANLRNTVYYSKLNTDGTMNAWQQASSFATARAGFGGTFSAIYGAYIYIGGGCTAVNGSGYCTTVASDMQITSMNADGTLDNWGSLGGLENTRIGYNFVAWQGGLYRFGGCSAQDSGTGVCISTLADVDYGVINPAGEVSTVNITTPSGSGTCTGGSPYNCDLPPVGDGAGQGGQMLSATTVLNGYLYVIGGCTNFACSQSSGNVSYVSIGSDGSLQPPPSCSGTSYGGWCVDNTNRVNGTSGVSAPGVTIFNDRIYIIGGIDETATGAQEIYYNTTNTNGSLTGAWSQTTFATAGIAGELAYTYAYARANPVAAGTNPGNLYIFGGCNGLSASAGCTSGAYNTQVYKCNIAVAGSINGCTTTGQLQLDVELATEPNQGLGLHSGTVYAGYIYLIGGYSANVADRNTVFYAKFDNNNNVVDVESGTADINLATDDWIESDNTLSVGRRRGWSFGYNGHIYSVGGYDDGGTGIIPFIEWAKMNVSDGSIDDFVTSSVTINQRWGLTMAVSNSYAYVIGGCDVGASPGGCSSFEDSIQTFQLYNNNSGAAADFTAQSDQTFTTATDRWGASSVVYNGYLYVAGGCTSATDCTAASNSVQYAPISSANGSVGTWVAGGNLPATRAWGSLQVAGGTLYYIGGQNSTATDERAEVYYTTGISSGNPTWGTASTPLPQARTRFGAAVWDDRIYVVGGLNTSATATNTVYYSPQLSSGGNITSAWTSTTAFNVARSGMGVTTYANNLYLFGGYTGSNYLSDTQYASIGYKAGTISQSGTTVFGDGTTFNPGQVGSIIKYLDGSTAIITGYFSGTQITVNVDKIVDAGTPYVIQDGSIGGWTYGTRMPGPLRDTQAISANGYIYLVGGRSANTTCTPKILITPVSANTTIVTGNNPTGIGEWYETNVRYTGNRYGAAVAYEKGKMYTMGGGCTSPLSTNRHYQSTIKSQPQVARYSRLIDTDIDVFPNAWLMNGVDNSIGARWQVRYRSMNDTDGVPTDCGTADMTTFGQDTFFGDTTLGRVEVYTPKDAAGNNIECARYFYFFVAIDASQTFGYPEDVNRGPTINDLSLFFTSDPSRRLRHGKTFSGGELQPLDTPCRVSGANPAGSQPNCPLP